MGVVGVGVYGGTGSVSCCTVSIAALITESPCSQGWNTSWRFRSSCVTANDGRQFPVARSEGKPVWGSVKDGERALTIKSSRENSL